MSDGEPVDLTDLGQAIDSLAGEVAARLAALRRELEPTRGLLSGAGSGAGLGPADEWTLAADGLLGPDGILGLISGAIRHEWPGYAGMGWTDQGTEAAGPRYAAVGTAGGQLQ